MDAPVLLARRGSAALATLNRPKALNALTLPMVQALRAAAADAAPSVLLLRGAGAGARAAFCAGGDVRSIHDQRSSGAAQQMAFFREEYLTDLALARHAARAVPHVALWDGVVMGGGVGVSIHATFRVATERTLFAMPETALGILPDVGSSLVLPRLALGPWWGLYLGLTGARLAGADAVHGGLATHFVPAERVGALEEALAALPASAPPPAAGAHAARAAAVARVLAAHATPPPALPPFSLPPAALAALARAFEPSGASLPAILARLRLEAGSGGAPAAPRQALAALEAASPTACAVTLEAQRRGAAPAATLQAVLAMELRAMAHMLGPAGSGDFYEGVRAVLLDKGKGAPAAWAALGEGADAARVVAAHFEGAEVQGERELLELQ